MKLLSYEQFNIVNESAKKFEQDLNEVLNEDLASIVSSPLKFLKIKNNAKKYQKTLVQQALNDLDLEKKKEASKAKGTPTGTLTAANKAKNASLKDLASSISTRIDDLASTDILKHIATIAKTKAKVAAAETALKAADGAESKALKIRIKNLNQKANDATADVKEYEREHVATKKDEAPKSDFESGKSDEKKTEVKPKKTETSNSEESDTKIIKDSPKVTAQKTELQKKISQQEDKIEQLKANIKIGEDDIPQLKADFEKVKGTDKEKAASDELAFQANANKKNKEQLEKEIETLKDLRKTLNEL